ncbi:MAG TPA: hypothetical protein VH478_07790, partial [Trebonia sp.]|nr:hypothetical protein [Trebonia sp.]
VTKTTPKAQAVTPRWLLRMLPWEEVSGGTYRVNRRLDGETGEIRIEIAAGHYGEPDLPGTFPDYGTDPREYPLSVAQTVLRVHTRVSDLYSQPMNQEEQQVRLTVEALREQQERDLISNPDFGLLANVAPRQRLTPAAGAPGPDDLDRLLSRRRKTRFFLAHPRAIAAFGRECTNRGVYPSITEVEGWRVMGWRGVPILPCSSIPVDSGGGSSILAMRTGLKDAGVVGLRQTGLDDEREPGLTVRRSGISEKGIASYLITASYSVAILVPDALGVLADVQT